MNSHDKRVFVVGDVEGQERVARFLSKCKTKLRITIQPYRPNRSLSQNALAHLWVSVLRKHLLDSTGQAWSHDDLWEAVKRKVLSPRIVPDLDTGEAREVYETRNLSVTEFSDFLRGIEVYCHEKWQLVLPHPEDLYDEAQGVRRAA